MAEVFFLVCSNTMFDSYSVHNGWGEFFLFFLKVEMEYHNPHSQERLPGSKVQHMWSQSLFILCQLLEGKFINIGEIDPLNRRLTQTPRQDTLVQGTSKPLFKKVQQPLFSSSFQTAPL